MLASRKPRGFARLDGFNPKVDLGELDGHRIAIDAIDTGAGHIVQDMAVVFGRCHAAGARMQRGWQAMPTRFDEVSCRKVGFAKIWLPRGKLVMGSRQASGFPTALVSSRFPAGLAFPSTNCLR